MSSRGKIIQIEFRFKPEKSKIGLSVPDWNLISNKNNFWVSKYSQERIGGKIQSFLHICIWDVERVFVIKLCKL